MLTKLNQILTILSVVFALFISGNSFSQNAKQTVFGKITYMDSPIPDVNVVVLNNKSASTQTDSKGKYTLQVSVGDKIQYSHVSFITVTIVVEDITSELNIRLRPKENKLDEVVIKSNVTDDNVLNKSIKAQRKFKTSRGSIDPRTSGFAVAFIEGDQFSNTYPNIQAALRGKLSGYVYDQSSGKSYLRGSGMSVNNDYPAAWEVDGVFSPDPPFALDLTQIENIYVLKSLASTNKYGTQGSGGVIVINTKYGNIQDREEQIKKVAEKYTNKNYYEENAVALNFNLLDQNTYTNTIASYNDKQKAVEYYNKELKSIKDYTIQLTLAKKFAEQYEDDVTAKSILNNLVSEHSKNPETLKAIAFQMQALGYNKEATRAYQYIYKLRPNYIQSFRDMSNAYLENTQFKRAWRIYLNGLNKYNEMNDEGIGEIIYSEMEWLFFNKKSESDITQLFQTKSRDKSEFSKDVRILIEWSTSEAEFDLEFVNPKNQIYEFKHSLVDNEELITKEKTKGYSSKEFFIDDIGAGNWLFNLTYHGNKKSTPTYFKITTYYNWSRPNQFKKVRVLPIKDLYDKIEILKINQLLLAQK